MSTKTNKWGWTHCDFGEVVALPYKPKRKRFRATANNGLEKYFPSRKVAHAWLEVEGQKK